MKLFARSSLLVICGFLFFVTPIKGQCKCTCRPSPPGGTTTCEAGHIAVCGANSSNVCEGKCVKTSTANLPVRYAAEVLSAVLSIRISEEDLFEQGKEAMTAIENVLTSNERKQRVTARFKDTEREVSVGLPRAGAAKLKNALVRLARRSVVPEVR